MSEEIVLIEENDEKTITTIKMNRLNKKNALNYELFKGLEDAFDEVQQSKTRVIILTGGDDVFSAGIDLKMLTGQDKTALGNMPKNMMNSQSFRYWLNTWLQPILTKIEKIEKPVIAKIDGYCYGSGFELALACDFRFALRSAKFTMPESKVGIITDVGGTIRLTRLVGISHAKDIILTGRIFNGEEAYRMGILNDIATDKTELDAIIKKYTDELIDSAPLAVGLGKKLIDDCYGKDLAFGMELEGLVNSQLIQTKDFMTGALARLQKTKPKWKGK
ncbi:MAG: enoyl-CoA hydratase/isomerase family protein [Candidatus Helarchaeota archaeon]